MRILVLFTFFTVNTLPLFCQTEWVPLNLNDHISFKFPAGYEEQDKKDTRIYGIHFEDQILMATKNPSKARALSSEKDVQDFYRGFQKGMQNESGHGEILFSKPVEIQGLLANEFAMALETPEEDLVFRTFVLVVKDTIYMMQSIYNQEIGEPQSLSFDKLISGVKVGELTRRDQYDPANRAFQLGLHTGEFIGNLVIPAIFILLIVLVIRGIRRMRKNKKI